MVKTFFLLISVHLVADYILQSEFAAKYKNRHAMPATFANHKSIHWWWQFLTAHAFLNGLLVYLVTNSYVLGICEIAVHWVIDFGKCEKMYGTKVDQILHFMVKIVWVVVLLINGSCP